MISYNMYKSIIIIFILTLLFYTLLKKSENYNNYNHIDAYYVINLDETNEGKRRWNIIKNHNILGSLVTRFRGTYGLTRNKKLYDNTIVSKSWDYGKWKHNKSKMISMTDGEIGVSISHYKLWKKLINSNMNIIMILEDDAIKISDDFLNCLQITLQEVPKDWDMILIGFWLHRGEKGYKVSKNISRVKDFALMHCYVINKKGSKKLLDKLPINAPLDTWVSGLSNDLNIYRHNFIRPLTKNPIGRIIRQKRLQKQILNTNNW